MKIIVRHIGIVEEAIEVDDKFDSLRGYNFNSTDEGDVLMDELIDTVLKKGLYNVSDLYDISTDDGEILTEF